MPDLIAHADWGSNANNRVLAKAKLNKDGSYLNLGLEKVPHPSSLLDSLRHESGPEGTILVGFDFPIGLPASYAEKAGINYFLDVLPQFGTGKWVEFYNIAEKPEQISLRRPFYPYRPGGARQYHLVNGLGLESFAELKRLCEVGRPSATPLFWTLGPSQVGRGAIIGWRDILAPALKVSKPDIKVWPFHGLLPELLTNGRIVVAETYPTAFRFQFGLENGKNQVSRSNCAHLIFNLASQVELIIPDNIREFIQNGFGNNNNSRDCFDAFVGLIGMLSIIRGNLPEGVLENQNVKQIEGWMLGRSIE